MTDARILEEVREHPRSHVIEALGEALYDLANEEGGFGGGMWHHLAHAYAIVEMLPALNYDEEVLCDESGCGAHQHPAGDR